MNADSPPTKTRSMTELEKQFVYEAQAGHFGVLMPDEDHDYPRAMGAVHTSNLFSMEVEEIPDLGQPGSIYFLPQEDA